MKLKYEKLLSSVAFNCNVRHYTEVTEATINDFLTPLIMLGRPLQLKKRGSKARCMTQQALP